ncbi:MAG: hypothetical protein ACO1PW_06420 [Actinomycetota bacterium]
MSSRLTNLEAANTENGRSSSDRNISGGGADLQERDQSCDQDRLQDRDRLHA